MAAGWTIRTWTGWSIMTVLATGVGIYASAFVIGGGIERVLPQMAYHVPDRALFAALHFGVGALVLVIGLYQFLSAFRSRWPVVHRWVGRVYVAGCITSGMAGLMLATYINTGPLARTGFSLLALSWIVTTSMAFLRARARDFNAHRAWMIRSYALTLAAVTLRIYLGIGTAAYGFGCTDMSAFLSFACWVPNLAVAEWMLRRPACATRQQVGSGSG